MVLLSALLHIIRGRLVFVFSCCSGACRLIWYRNISVSKAEYMYDACKAVVVGIQIWDWRHAAVAAASPDCSAIAKRAELVGSV